VTGRRMVMPKCKSCGEEIYFHTTKNGKSMPLNKKDNRPHWVTCPDANKFRKRDKVKK
jgi:hypothetical protein